MRALLMPWLVLLAVGCQCGAQGDSQPDSGGDSQQADSGDSASPGLAPVSDLAAEQHEQVATVLLAQWTQQEQVEAAWIEFSFENDEWLQSPAESGASGAREELILGVPGDSELRWRVANELEGQVLYSEEQQASTGAVPEQLPWPEPQSSEPSLAGPQRWLFGSIELSTLDWYEGPWGLFILDRQGRVVWYWEVPENRCTMHAKPSRDGSHLVFEETSLYTDGVGESSLIHRMSLDLSYSEETALPGLGSTFDETDDGGIVFDSYSHWPNTRLEELQADGERRLIWTCNDWMKQYSTSPYYCDPNETLWFSGSDTIIWSMWRTDTAVEIQRDSGELLRQWGGLEGSWSFEPPEAGWDMQHYVHYTEQGTLLVSTHTLGGQQGQRAREYVLDDETQTLTQIWSYGQEVPHYATYAGEAMRLDNGNTLINYGTSGCVREITPEAVSAWNIEWPDTYLVGHVTLLDDLYALARGPEQARRP